MKDVFHSSAIFSPCRKYRYTLTRIWNGNKPLASFIGLNPSTADEIKNDPTVTRCINYAKRWGYGGIIMLNIFAFRATVPKMLKSAAEPIGKDTDVWITAKSQETDLTIACWGTHGEFMDRGKEVLKLLNDFKCLGITKHGYPKHPLYLRNDLEPIDFY